MFLSLCVLVRSYLLNLIVHLCPRKSFGVLWCCVYCTTSLNNVENSDSGQADTMLGVCRSTAMMRISEKGPIWKQGVKVFRCLRIPKKQFFIIVIITGLNLYFIFY